MKYSYDDINSLCQGSLKGDDKKDKTHQSDCLCRILDKFIKGKEINMITKSGDIIQGEFVCVTDDGCVVILEPAIITPYSMEKVTFIRCKDIESFSVDAKHENHDSS